MNTTDVLKLTTLAEYRQQRQHIFPSQSSLDWYLRRNRSALVANGALLLLTGRWFVNAERFDTHVLQAATSAARAHAARGDRRMDQGHPTPMDNNDNT